MDDIVRLEPSKGPGAFASSSGDRSKQTADFVVMCVAGVISGLAVYGLTVARQRARDVSIVMEVTDA